MRQTFVTSGTQGGPWEFTFNKWDGAGSAVHSFADKYLPFKNMQNLLESRLALNQFS